MLIVLLAGFWVGVLMVESFFKKRETSPANRLMVRPVLLLASRAAIPIKTHQQGYIKWLCEEY